MTELLRNEKKLKNRNLKGLKFQNFSTIEKSYEILHFFKYKLISSHTSDGLSSNPHEYLELKSKLRTWKN